MNNWNGEGMPKVGDTCLVLNESLIGATSEQCKILYMGSWSVVYDSESCKERYGNLNTCKFNQIPDPKQVAIDAAVNEIYLLMSATQTMKSANGAARRIYDAGYRKLKPLPKSSKSWWDDYNEDEELGLYDWLIKQGYCYE